MAQPEIWLTLGLHYHLKSPNVHPRSDEVSSLETSGPSHTVVSGRGLGISVMRTSVCLLSELETVKTSVSQTPPWPNLFAHPGLPP